MNILNYLLENEKMILLQETVQHIHPVWYNAYFYLFITIMITFSIVSILMMKIFKKKASELKLMQQQYVARIDNIRKEHSDALEKIRLEMLKREEERSRQWMESEKETLHVLSGVSSLLDLSEKIGRVDSEKIMKKLDEIQLKVEQKTEKII